MWIIILISLGLLLLGFLLLGYISPYQGNTTNFFQIQEKEPKKLFETSNIQQYELTEEDKEWLEAPLVDEEEWDEDHAMDQVLNEMVEDIPEEEWRIEDEDKEPYEVYTGPKEEITPLQTQIESIQNDKHLSEWGKRSKIEEATTRFKKESLGKIY